MLYIFNCPSFSLSFQFISTSYCRVYSKCVLVEMLINIKCPLVLLKLFSIFKIVMRESQVAYNLILLRCECITLHLSGIWIEYFYPLMEWIILIFRIFLFAYFEDYYSISLCSLHSAQFQYMDGANSFVILQELPECSWMSCLLAAVDFDGYLMGNEEKKRDWLMKAILIQRSNKMLLWKRNYQKMAKKWARMEGGG